MMPLAREWTLTRPERILVKEPPEVRSKDRVVCSRYRIENTGKKKSDREGKEKDEGKKRRRVEKRREGKGRETANLTKGDKLH